MSERTARAEAGFNGGFEFFEKGLPANWLMYTPNTVPDADFHILADSVTKHNGRQSLLFEVRSCTAKGGRLSPGLANEIPAGSGADYIVSLWVKSEGAGYRVVVNSVNATQEAARQTLDQRPKDSAWHQHTFRCRIWPKMDRLRLELNVTSPGRVWIDDVRMEKASVSEARNLLRS